VQLKISGFIGETKIRTLFLCSRNFTPQVKEARNQSHF